MPSQDIPLSTRTDSFAHRHLGPRDGDIRTMLETLGASSLDDLMDKIVPEAIRSSAPLNIPEALGEVQVLEELGQLAEDNCVFRSFLGMGYHGTITPPVILRNILENPGWYTQYTPYQAEISQGRLEALLNYQTMVMDLTGTTVANSSLLDEATAAAEAMTMSRRVLGRKAKDKSRYFVSAGAHPQTIDVIKTRAEPLDIDIVVGKPSEFVWDDETFGALLQYPNTDGTVDELAAFCKAAHDKDALVTVATDLLSLTMLKSPGSQGADVVVGNSQRFGVPMGYGGPHAAFMGAREEFKRQMPGRIIGVTIDQSGKPALRMALQTREQHIRRDKATSNICTAQVLLAIVASMYGVYHGPEGLSHIARRVHAHTKMLADALRSQGCHVHQDHYFDTIRVTPKAQSSKEVEETARAQEINLRELDHDVVIALDETTSIEDLRDIMAAFGRDRDAIGDDMPNETSLPPALVRDDDFMTHSVFHTYRSETELLRYMNRLQARDLSLTTSMIPLGSCTMKLNATAEMIPVTWAGFGALHPFVPVDQAKGYQVLHDRLESWLCDITGFAACSLQPNAGSQGEYTGLLTIRAHHRANGQEQRDVCLIPSSAHGTNPASAIMAGMHVVVVACDDEGNIDVDDLRAKAEANSEKLAALMVTYPSTHGVFEATIKEICSVVHEHGGQVYLDGANMNALVGIARPGEFGADVLHLNLHKTFCIPHGGGGPGMGPICVAEHLAPFLPGHPVVQSGGGQGIGAVAAAPWGSPSILPISYAYIAMMGPDGLTKATQVAILNANYIAKRLEGHYPVLYKGRGGFVAHECILDVRDLQKTADIQVADIAKRLMDYSFHAPTMSWPVAGTLMVEPTESESKEELDRFCDAMIAIREEVRAIEGGSMDRADNPLKNAPHTAEAVMADEWNHAYSREQAAFPAPWLKDHKYWPAVGRVNDVHGDRNLVCACPPLEAYAS